MQKFIVGSVTLVALLVSSGRFSTCARAADRPRPIRIGALTSSWGPTPGMVGIRDGLLELGYREDVDFVLGVRFTQGNLAALPTAARELVQHGVDIIITSTGAPTKAAQGVTTHIPIVFTRASTPVEAGLVKSFAHPGGNITGVAILRLKLSPKKLQVFQELIPTLQRVLYLYNVNDANSVARAQAYRDAASRLGVMLVERPVRTTEEAQAVLDQTRKGEVDGIVQPIGVSLNLPGLILKVATQRGIPTMFDAAFYVERGGLVSYGPDYYASGRQAARLVDKILKGTKPAEIPVEVNSKIEFVINMKSAKALGLTLPPEVLYRADRIIR
jgi:putative ABC transport system substrate-binding protein